ncbi:MAG: hypothetical protein COA79_04900 [Planctomycetota bacterium]|nr:MAG: hypothetical protein COA79_04900 [Planctomycetota bacterium]
MLQLIRPTIATIAIYTLMAIWNNFMEPLIFLNDDRHYPLALGMFKFSNDSEGDISLLMAGSFLMIIPILLMFFFFQKYIIKGISLGGLKDNLIIEEE